MKIKAIFFDQDGVIIDTEKDGHRVAFNETFKEMGLDIYWDEDYYHELLQIGGGKERLMHHIKTRGIGKEISPDEVENLIKEIHHLKTGKFIRMVESGSLKLRPGIYRFMQEGMDEGLILGICTTSNEKVAHSIVEKVIKDINFILAGDIVSRKKPDPEIYLLALSNTGFQPQECLVIEDSSNGVKAAKAAKLNVVATTNHYTENENLDDADIIVDCLGDPDGDNGKLKKGDISDYDGILHVKQLINYF